MPKIILDAGKSATMNGVPLFVDVTVSRGMEMVPVAVKFVDESNMSVTATPYKFMGYRLADLRVPVNIVLVPSGQMDTFAAGTSAQIVVHQNDPNDTVSYSFTLDGLNQRDAMQLVFDGATNSVMILALEDSRTFNSGEIYGELEGIVNDTGIQRLAADERRPIVVVVDASASFRKQLEKDSAMSAAVSAINVTQGCAKLIGDGAFEVVTATADGIVSLQVTEHDSVSGAPVYGSAIKTMVDGVLSQSCFPLHFVGEHKGYAGALFVVISDSAPGELADLTRDVGAENVRLIVLGEDANNCLLSDTVPSLALGTGDNVRFNSEGVSRLVMSDVIGA